MDTTFRTVSCEQIQQSGHLCDLTVLPAALLHMANHSFLEKRSSLVSGDRSCSPGFCPSCLALSQSPLLTFLFYLISKCESILSLAPRSLFPLISRFPCDPVKFHADLYVPSTCHSKLCHLRGLKQQSLVLDLRRAGRGGTGQLL